jgi:hypothetical protein
MPDRKPRPAPHPTSLTRKFFATLFDFSFSEFITVQMLPFLYGVMLACAIFGIVYLTVEAFLVSLPRGFFYLFVAGPVAFIAIATILRALIEFYIVVFRIAENIDDMHLVTKKFSGITNTMDEVKGFTKKLPFWSMKPKPEEEERPRRRRKEQNWPY